MGTILSRNNGKLVRTDNPEQFLMELLVKKTRQAGHMLSFEEASQDPEMVEPNNFAPYFSSFSEAAKTAWRKVQSPQASTLQSSSSPVRIIPKTKKPPEIGKKEKFFRFNNPPTRAQIEKHEAGPDDYLDNEDPVEVAARMQVYNPENRTQKYSYDKVKAIIIAFYKRNGRLPTIDDTKADPNLPCLATIYKYLGGKREWEKLISSSLRENETPLPPDNPPVEGQETEKPVTVTTTV